MHSFQLPSPQLPLGVQAPVTAPRRRRRPRCRQNNILCVAAYCNDGVTVMGPNWSFDGNGALCHTNGEASPWLKARRGGILARWGAGVRLRPRIRLPLA